MNIINDPYSSRTAGVGQGITTALQGLLEGVAHGKAKELHQRNISRALQPYGFSPEQAQAFSFLPLTCCFVRRDIKQQKARSSKNKMISDAVKRERAGNIG